jgi:hypothetical protein
MTAKILRVVVLAAAVTGLLTLFGGPAAAYIGQQHCEPIKRS